MDRYRLFHRLLRPLAAGALVASLGLPAQAELLRLAKDGVCYEYDTASGISSEAIGECQGELPVPVSNLADELGRGVQKIVADSATVINKAYTPTVETRFSSIESDKLQVFSLASGYFAVKAELTVSVGVTLTKAGWAAAAAPNLEWKPENSIVSMTIAEVPAVFFVDSLTHGNIAAGIDYVRRQQVERVAQLFGELVEGRQVPVVERVTIKVGKEFLPQLARVDAVAILNRVNSTFADLGAQLGGRKHPGFDRTPQEELRLLQGLLEKVTRENHELLEKLASSDIYNQSLLASISELKRRNEELQALEAALQEKVVGLEGANTSFAAEVDAFKKAYVGLAIDFNYEGWGKETPSYNAELVDFVSRSVHELWNLYAVSQDARFECDNERATLQVDLERSQTVIAKITLELERFKQEMAILTTAYEAEKAKLEETIKELQLGLVKRDETIFQLERTVEELRAEKAKLVASYEAKLEELNAYTKETIARYEQELKQLYGEIEKLKFENELLNKELATANEGVKKLEENTYNLEAQLEKERANGAELEKQLVGLKLELEYTAKERDEMLMQLAAKDKELESLGSALREIEEEYAKVRQELLSRYEVLSRATDIYTRQVADALGVRCEAQELPEDVAEYRELDERSTRVRTEDEAFMPSETEEAPQLLQEASEPEAKQDLAFMQIQDVADQEVLDTGAICDTSTLQPRTLEALRNHIESLVAAQLALKQNTEVIAGLEEQLKDAKLEPAWSVIKAVDEAVREGELIDASYLEGASFDALVNKLNERVANVGAALECLPTEAAKLVERLEAVRAAASQSIVSAQDAQCVADRAGLIARATDALSFVSKALALRDMPPRYTEESVPNDYVIAICNLMSPASCVCVDSNFGVPVSTGIGCYLMNDLKIYY